MYQAQAKKQTADTLTAFSAFLSTAQDQICVVDENSYELALSLSEELMFRLEDNPDDLAASMLFELVTSNIERYQDEQENLQEFRLKFEDSDPAVSMLRVIIDQHGLKLADFENEIGKKAYVSSILAGDRKLSKEHITKLSERFNRVCCLINVRKNVTAQNP